MDETIIAAAAIAEEQTEREEIAAETRVEIAEIEAEASVAIAEANAEAAVAIAEAHSGDAGWQEEIAALRLEQATQAAALAEMATAISSLAEALSTPTPSPTPTTEVVVEDTPPTPKEPESVEGAGQKESPAETLEPPAPPRRKRAWM